MKDIFQSILELKTQAKYRRDRRQYQKAAETLTGKEGKDGTIQLIREELSAANQAGWKTKLASELSDCFGLLGGICRRWALESESPEERNVRLRDSIVAYEQGYEVEKNPEYSIVDSYNMVNRLVSYIILKPESLANDPANENAAGDIWYNVRQELLNAEMIVKEQLEEKRRGNIWALADQALVKLLLDNIDPLTAFNKFNLENPPDYAYDSVLSTLDPLAALDIPVAGKLKVAKKLLEDELGKLRK